MPSAGCRKAALAVAIIAAAAIVCRGAQAQSIASVPFSAADGTTIANSAESVLREAAAPRSDQPAHIAIHCLAAVGLARAGNDDARPKLRASVDKLLSLGSRNANGELTGWRYIVASRRNCAGPGTLDPFSDGTCNPPETTYAFQTGLATTCLARAALELGDAEIGRSAAEALNRWAALTDSPPDCPECIYFRYTDHPNDLGRSVRNTNVLMGMAAAWTFAATGEKQFERLARRVASTELREMRSGNFGYYSIDDPRFIRRPDRERVFIDNHTPYVAKGLLDIALLTGDAQAREASERLMDWWLACGGRDCSSFSCQRWAGQAATCDAPQVVSPCFFRYVPASMRRCEEAVAHIPRLEGYQLWALLDGYLVRPPRN